MRQILRHTPRLLSGAALLCSFTCISGPSAAAQSAPGPTAKVPSAAFAETLDQAVNKHAFRVKSPRESRWLDGGERYTVLEPATAAAPGPDSTADSTPTDLVVYDTGSGKRTVLVAARQFTPAGGSKPLDIDDYSWSEDKKQLLLFTNSKKVWRRNTRGDYWVLNLGSGKLTKLGGNAAPSTLMFAKFSPDGRAVAFVRENNLFVEDPASGKIRQLTADGSVEIINGTSDWVNEEELDIRDGFRWSPDSQSIAYWQFDQTGVGDYTLINDTAERYPTLFRYRYPQVGTTNAAVRAGIVAVKGGKTRWVKLPGDPRQQYIARMEWVGDSDELTLEVLNRAQNTAQVFLANGHSGDPRLLFEDHDAAWVDVVDQLAWVGPQVSAVGQPTPPTDAQPSASAPPPKPSAPALAAKKTDLVWLSDRDGWRHAWLVSRSTGQLRLITNFAGDIIAPVTLDEQHGFFYFTASPDDPIRAYLYRARLDGSGTPERLTPAGQPGTHTADVSPNGQYAIDEWSTAARPPRYSLVHLPGHTVVRSLEDNDAVAAKVAPLLLNQEFTDTGIGGGIRLSTSVIKPPHFDPSKKYPVLTYTYGEPADAVVRDRWGSPIPCLFAREGYIIVSFDNQGTPAPRGRTWRKAAFRTIGVLNSQQQAEAIQSFAKSHPFVDTTRMAVWGWSGGGSGTLNLMFRHPGLYATGMAVAPEADQLRYDTIYQERYMGLPSENAQVYHDGSPINFASGLTGNLLIVHGSGDDNVHFQGTELLVDKLIELGKPFDFMDYPNRTHGISEGKNTTDHLFTLLARYLETHVPPGPRPQ